MTYAEACQYLLALTNLPRRQYLSDARSCAWYLNRVRFFLKLIGSPEKRLPHIIHVTGTSGKGSVCLMLESILRAARWRVGTLTSPHPSAIVERWHVNGKAISRRQFAALVSGLEPAIEQCARATPFELPSISEFMTALGLCYFVQKKVDWTILEVGCGGRWDSTNVVPRKDIAVITNIGLDHTELLGGTKTKIAYEKAGIIKPGCRAVTAERDPKVLPVITKECRRQRVPLVSLAAALGRVTPRLSKAGISFFYDGALYHLPVIGTHQVANAVVAITVARMLGVPTAAIQRGLKCLSLPIRMELVSRRPLIILDSAHNRDKMDSTVRAMLELKKVRPFRSLHLLIGFAANKDITAMLRQLAGLKPKTVACTRFTSNLFRKAADPRRLAALVKRYMPRAKVEVFLDPLQALAWSQKQQQRGDALLSTGSIFLSGQLRPWLKKS